MSMKKVRYGSVSRAIAALAFVLFFPANAAAQDVAAWFAKPANAAAYGSIAAEVETLGASIRASSLSDSLLAKRLEEAAKKHISPPTLLATLKSDTARVLFVSKALGSRGLLSADRKKATFAVEQTTLFLRAGIGETELETVLDAAVRKRGQNDEAVSRTLAALAVAATAEANYNLPRNESLLLAVGLVACDLPDGKFDSILASMATLVKKGGTVSEALKATIEKVSKGNSDNYGNKGAAGNESKSGGNEKPENAGNKNNGNHGKGVGNGSD